MNNLPPKEFYTIIAGGALLSANAGFINVVSMAGIFPGVPVSHVTGISSRLAISLFYEDYENFALVLSILISFMFGSFISGYFVGDCRFRLGAPYGVCLALESAALFGSFLFLRKEYILGEWLAAFACGLQNAMATSYSGMAVRTTHMTGVVTDIGNICGQACRTDKEPELWRLKIQIPILFGFIVGGMCGMASWTNIREYSLLIPVIFTGMVSIAYLSLPFVNEAKKKLDPSMNLMLKEAKKTLDQVSSLVVPDKPELEGLVNPSAELYRVKITKEMEEFIADIDNDRAVLIQESNSTDRIEIIPQKNT